MRRGRWLRRRQVHDSVPAPAPARSGGILSTPEHRPARLRRLVVSATTVALVAGLALTGTAAAEARTEGDPMPSMSTPLPTAGQLAGAAAPAAPTSPSASSAAQQRAWAWLRSMMQSSTATTGGTVTPARPYDAAWTGPVRGRWTAPSGTTLPDATPGTVVVDPAIVTAVGETGYRGVVRGSVTLAPTANRWIIQVYRDEDGTVRQVPLQTLVQPDGTWSLDLSSVTDPGAGRWEFGVLDATAGYAPSGDRWPAGARYPGLELRLFATTDRTYPVGTAPATADGSFEFSSSAPGAKSVQLVDERGAAPVVLAEWAPDTGLIRSTAGADRTYTYDQALALQAALAVGDDATADRLADGLMALQTPTGPQAGAFVSSAGQWNPAGGQAMYRTGNVAVATAALVAYVRWSAPGTARNQAAATAARRGLDWLAAQQTTAGPNAGLLTGGFGEDVGGTFDPAAAIAWMSTEHNLDAWQAFTAASTVLACGDCAQRADRIRAGLLQVCWNATEGRFRQGVSAQEPDDTDPLDVNSWGALFLDRIGRSDLSAQALSHTAAFAVSDGGAGGYLTFRSQPSMPHPVPTVWFEGSFGVALAQLRHGDTVAAEATVGAAAPAQRPDGSFPAVTTADPATGYTNDSSTAATAWFLLATADGDRGIWR
ncbi:hypothetical protein [Nakamurella endophytica]|uniref:Uncharacterized protein n=1 Tax=Nakamurella endophytica TaxID=1748367 RepID=A0A917WCR9_9ACTN|nr:hypothetical protein [Nakamurella endophytica]GGL90484.1 hypothetical protein GCM10011594_07650 [Nakamurella endophytica]